MMTIRGTLLLYATVFVGGLLAAAALLEGRHEHAFSRRRLAVDQDGHWALVAAVQRPDDLC